MLQGAAAPSVALLLTAPHTLGMDHQELPVIQMLELADTVVIMP